MKASTLLEGAGTGLLLTLGLTWNQLSAYHLDLYHRQLPISTVIRAIDIDLLLACAFGIFLAWLLHRADAKNRTLLWILFAAALSARAVGGLISAELITRQGITPLRVFLAVFAAGALLWLLKRTWYAVAMRGVQALLMLFGFCTLWVPAQLLHLGTVQQPHDRLAFSTPIPKQPVPHRRVVWLLFDEASYDQIFDHRQPGLDLPNFDRLHAVSTTFSDVTPAGYMTEEVLPSLLLGQPVQQIRSTKTGDLLLRSTRQGQWKPFDPNATLFSDAQRLHLTTGLVGSYNPYCRLLPDQLDVCWTQLLLFGDHLSGQKSTLQNVVAPAYATVARILHLPLEHTPTDAEKFHSLMDAANALVANEDIDFAFVHLPVPHPPGLYHRSTGVLAPGGSYIDNLALADRTLGELEATLASTASAPMTTLIVSSDHSWRVPMWRNAIGWTAEDERASGGRFDTRPLLMVRLPGQTQPQTITQPLPALKEHDMIENFLQGSVTQAELDAWIAKQN
jgi:predicted outer membrane lipoprotein